MDQKTALIYDDLLRFQAELSFDLEQSFFRNAKAWNRAHRVLDFGAGNGYYTRKLAEAHPEKEFIIVEKEPHLADLARRWVSGTRATVVTGTYSDLPTEDVFDFVLARHVVSYMPDRLRFMEWITAHTAAGAGILTIDAEDSELFITPKMPLLEGGNEKFKDEVHAAGGKRDLRLTIDREWAQHGFSAERSRVLVVHSEIAGRKHLMHSFMNAVAMFDHGSPLPEAVRTELSAWIQNPGSYMQYGLFGASYVGKEVRS